MNGEQRSEPDAAPSEAASTHTSGDHSPPHDPPTSFPETWGDLRLIAEIGRGGFGRVFRAYDADLKREVALKVIKLRDAAHRAAVLKEGQMLASVRHNNVVTVYRAQQIGDEIGLTMELIRGRHLGDLVRQGGPMGAEEAAVIGVSLCQALAAAHGQGLLHRDVKSRNVMRESGGRIVLMDFGAGREVQQIEHVKRAELSGTPLYLAPELFAGRPASPASDLYSLGVLLFYLVTQKYPVDGATLADLVLTHGSRQRRLLSDVRPDLPAAFVQVVEHALAARPEQRYRTAGEMMAELRATLPISEAVTPPSLPAPIPPRPSSLLRALIAAPLVILAIGLFGMLTSAQYSYSLGRDAGFSDDTVLDWWIVGVRSLIPVLVYVGGLLLVVTGIGAIWHFVQRMAPPVRRATDLARTSVSGGLRRWGGSDRSSVAQAVIVLQILMVAGVFWGFRYLFEAFFLKVNDAEPSDLDRLYSGSHEVLMYRVVLSVVLSAMIAAWYRLLVRPTLPGAISPATIAGGMALILLVLLMIEVPYRILHRITLPQVTYNGMRCFEVGSRNSRLELLLYCPDKPAPRNVPVPASDPGLRMEGTGELFAPRPEAAGK